MNTPIRHRRKSSIVSFLNSAKKSTKALTSYTSSNSFNTNSTSTKSTNSVGGIVDSLKKKDAVSAAMLRSCSIPVSSTSQTPPPVHSTLFVSRIHKPDHSYNGGEGASDYSSLKFWREGKERFVGVVRGGEVDAEFTDFMYCVVIPNDGESSEGQVAVEIRHRLPLKSLRKVICPGGNMGASRAGGNLELKFEDSTTIEFSATPQMFAGENDNGFDTRESVVWNLMQLQKYLYKKILTVDGIDTEELEFLSSVHGFLADNNALCELIDQMEEEEEEGVELGARDGSKTPSTRTPSPRKKAAKLFSDRQEEMDAEAVLNSLPWANTDLEGLKVMLQGKLEGLEVECYKQLIEWEKEGGEREEKDGGSGSGDGDETKESLGSLVSTLAELDDELAEMEKWLEERNLAIKPLTVDCREIENENNALEQTWRSYGALAQEMDRLLNGLSIDVDLEKILKDPLGHLGVNKDRGRAQFEQIDSDTINRVHNAGSALRAALDRAAEGGGVHLTAVNQRVETLLVISGTFCRSLGDFLLEMFQDLGEDMAAGLYVIEGGAIGSGQVTYDGNKEGVALKIRNTQRRFQTLVMEFQPLVETLGSLKPEVVVSLRRGYAVAVEKGVYSRKMVGEYFEKLRGVGEGEGLDPVAGEGWGGGWLGEGGGMGLKDYAACDLRWDGAGERMIEGIGSDDKSSKISTMGTELEAALGDFVPMIAREGYFIASLFGLDAAEGDTDAVKNRKLDSICGCIQVGAKVVEDGLKLLAGVGGSEVLKNLVGSLKIKEASEKLDDDAGGELYAGEVLRRMKVETEKVWEAWVEDQVAWVQEGCGIPYNGKRAGVFSSFARFPTFVDRVILNVGENKEGSEVVARGIVRIAEALFSCLKSVMERAATDKQYACNVIVLENCNFFLVAMSNRREGLGTSLDRLLEEARVLFERCCNKYVRWMIKREFKGLYALFSNIARIRKDVGDEDVLIHCPRSTFVRTLGKEAGGGEVKEKVGEIRKRMEKHTCEESGALALVWEELGGRLMKDYGEFQKVSGTIFSVKFEVRVGELGKLMGAEAGVAIMRRRSGGDKKEIAK